MEPAVSISLSFVLPIHNAESTFAQEARHLLELLAELSVSFELLVIDDGSTDDTLYEARELSRHFAQIRVIHRPLRYGHSAAVELGLREARGRFVMIYNNRSCPVALEIRDLWESRLLGPPAAVEARAPSRRALHGSLIDDHGFVLEAGPLILVRRWPRPDASRHEAFVRFPAGIRSTRTGSVCSAS